MLPVCKSLLCVRACCVSQTKQKRAGREGTRTTAKNNTGTTPSNQTRRQAGGLLLLHFMWIEIQICRRWLHKSCGKASMLGRQVPFLAGEG